MSETQHPSTYEQGVDLAWQANEAFDQMQADRQVERVMRDQATRELREIQDKTGVWHQFTAESPTYGKAFEDSMDRYQKSSQNFNALSDAAGSLLTSPGELRMRENLRQLENREANREQREKYVEDLSKCPPLEVSDQAAWQEMKDNARKDSMQQQLIQNMEDFGRFAQEALDRGEPLEEALRQAEAKVEDIGHSGSSFGYMMGALEHVWSHGPELKEFKDRQKAA